jgi:hypothetical protein
MADFKMARERKPWSSRRRRTIFMTRSHAPSGFIVTVYDEDGLKLAAMGPFSNSAKAFEEARKIVNNKVEGPSRAGGDE